MGIVDGRGGDRDRHRGGIGGIPIRTARILHSDSVGAGGRETNCGTCRPARATPDVIASRTTRSREYNGSARRNSGRSGNSNRALARLENIPCHACQRPGVGACTGYRGCVGTSIYLGGGRDRRGSSRRRNTRNRRWCLECSVIDEVR